MWKLLSSSAHPWATTDVFAVCSPTVVTFCSPDGTTERAQNDPTDVLSCFSETAGKDHMSRSQACAEERSGTSNCSWNQSPAAFPLPLPHRRNQRATTRLDPKCHSPLGSEGGRCPGGCGAEAPYSKWPSSNVFQLKRALPVFPHTCAL